MKGIDYAWGPKPYDEFKRQGVRFVMRYISHDPSKDLTALEKQELFKRGIAVGLVFESTADRALAGFAAGHADGQFAKQRAAELGLKDVPIYFGVDFDATDRQKPTIREYLRGARSALGRERVGVYGGYWVVKDCYDHQACSWFWQTYAWSGGLVHPATHIYQHKNGVRMGGLSVDLNESRKPVFGVQAPPNPEHHDPPVKPAAVPGAFFLWFRWYFGLGEFQAVGRRYKPLRPAVPVKVPASWWRLARLLQGGK